MALSGTYEFNLDIGEIIEEAFEKAGVQDYSGHDYRTARRSLNLLLTDWLNRGVNLWTMDLATLTLTSGTATYLLATETVDIIDAVVRDATTSVTLDTTAYRISMEEYLSGRSNKSAGGKPNQFTVERNSVGGHRVYVWPLPTTTGYSLLYWRVRYIQDLSATGGDQTVDIPRRFLPALTAGLAYHIAIKKLDRTQEASLALIALLKAEYDDAFQAARFEDRERSDFHIIPYVGYRI